MPQDVTTFVLDGRVVTMNSDFEVLDRGRVYVRDGGIAAVRAVDAPAPDGFSDAPLVRTGGTIYPGLIELHNHLAYNVLPLWQVPRRYGNRGQWGSHPTYRSRISGPMGVLGRSAGYIEAVVRYVEVKCLLGGVTTSQGVALFSNAGIRRYYRGMVRNVEQPGTPGLPAADTRIADVEARNAAGFRERLERSSCLLLHLAEGVDDRAREHFQALRVDGRQWAITDALAGIHCAGLRGRDFATLRSRGGSMIWSPLSNLLLYGDTADIGRAASERVSLALGSDWAPSGSKNLLGEMKVAWLVAQERDAGLTARDIAAMTTINAARIVKWDGLLGSVEPGKRADLIVVNGRQGEPYEHLVRARETGLTLVVIDGAAAYGQPRMMRQLGHDGEALEVGGSSRILDLTDAAADPIVGALSFADARDRLADGMATLPDLARRLEEPDMGAALFGTTSATEPGSWFLELDHEPIPGFSDEPHLPLHGAVTGAFPELYLGAPLSEVVEAVDLDPVTVADDGDFFGRLAASPNVPEWLLSELPPLYGERRRTRPPGVVSGGLVSAEGAGEPVTLADFLAAPRAPLSTAGRRLLVDQAIVLLGETYVHLELKRAMHAVEPIQRLRLLRYRLSRPDGAAMSELAFHRELASIFASLRDLHTNYLLPRPFRESTAFLPFLLEEYHEDGQPHYLVTKVLDGFEHPTFVAGVEVVHWNGVQVRRAIEANAQLQAGSNAAAAFARGLDAMTIRPLVRSLPPDEDWVVVTYVGADGVERDARWDWRVWSPPSGLGVDPDAAEASAEAASLGYDLLTDAVSLAKKVMFAPQAFALEQAVGAVAAAPVAVGDQDVPTSMPTVFRARPVTTPSGTFGYVRMFTFNVGDAGAFVEEFARLAGLLPRAGLVLDVRGNGGGLILAAEQLLQVFTPRDIQPSRAQFVTTPLMLDLCERHAPSPLDPGFDLSPWIESMRQAVTTGAVYSQAQPITDRNAANAVGQLYQGPVVLITDGLCYSATDMFAAGFRDHDIGTILGVADNTGAGGANVWTHELLRVLMDVSGPGDAVVDNPFRPLPGGAGMRVSVRRTTRVGALDGTPLEDLGVEPDVRHHMTRADVLDGNRDLIAHAGELLAAAPVHRLDVEVVVATDGALRLKVAAVAVDRVDVWIDGRPVDSFDVTAAETSRRVTPPAADPEVVELRGHLEGRPVARARHLIDRE